MKYLNINNYIAGIDEVGRGCYAGPCVVCSVVLGDYHDARITDSKKLTSQKIKVLALDIITHAKEVNIEIINVNQIDQFGIKQVVIKAMEKLANKTNAPLVFVDFEKIKVNKPTISLQKGDLLIEAISAASIVAKFYRDQIMQLIDQFYPEYDFCHNVGYGTKKHQQALEKFGYIKNIHRISYKPVQKIGRVYEKN